MNMRNKVNQMAHLKQKQISDSSCKSIIVDTLLESVCSLTQEELSVEICSLFHVLVSNERLNTAIQELSKDGVVFIDQNGNIDITPTRKAEFTISRLNETSLQNEAIRLWIGYIKTFHEISEDLEQQLTRALPVFLRTMFIKHGVSSYELLTSSGSAAFDIKEVSSHVSKQFDSSYSTELADLLPTIFQTLNYAEVVEYLKHNIEKAVGYISEVISDDNLIQLKSGLKNLTVYLDTNTIYRLLHLQGDARFSSIKETIDFCKESGVRLKVSATTKKELSARLKYDASVLVKYPTRTDLIRAGYKYRTSDNYVSTYWNRAITTSISVEDFIEYYNSFDILLGGENIEIEEIEVDDNGLINKANHYFERMSLRDPLHEKSNNALWHDAFSLAYIQKMQKVDAKNAIDTQCLFLTTDQALTSFQREDHDFQCLPPVVISPSQLLQIYSFTTPDSGYEETFIQFFASSSLGISFKYSNDDIQEILSRIAHYNGVNIDIAERVLSRELVNSRFLADANDEEKEEIIYNAISEELLFELDLTKEAATNLKAEKETLSDDYRAAIELMEENESRFSVEKSKLQKNLSELNEQKEKEYTARQEAEIARQDAERRNTFQEKIYLDEKMDRWKAKRIWIFWLGIALSVIIIIVAIVLWCRLSDSGCLGILALLVIPSLMITCGAQAFSVEKAAVIREAFIKDYHNKIDEKQQQ